MSYETNAVWGADYRRAIANGDTAYAQKLRTAMDAQPQAANTAGMISANHLMTNYNPQSQANTWMNGAEGQQVNGLGQIRTAQPTQGWNVGAGTNGNLYKFNGQSAPAQPSQIIGQAQPTTPFTPNPVQPTGGNSVPAAPWGTFNGFGPSVRPQTATAYQTGYKPQSPGLLGGGLFGGLMGGVQRPQWNFGGSTMGNETHGMQSPYGYGQFQYGQRGYASPYQTGYKGLLG